MNSAKKMEEKHTMGKTGNLFKKIRNIKGTFDSRMGTIMDRDGKEITEWERLEISSRKLEIPREGFMQRWAR